MKISKSLLYILTPALTPFNDPPTQSLPRAKTYTASINHCYDGECYELTARLPTATHLCLSHVLSLRNSGTDAGSLEVWGGPLSNGRWVLGLLNRGGSAASINAPFSYFGSSSIGPTTTACVRDAWAQASR